MTKTIGILTGGGDVPGLNPCIKAVVMNALEQGYRVIGIRRGWAGLLHYNQNEPSTRDYYVRELHEEDVRTIDRTGGTVLHTSRTNPQRVSLKDAPDFLKNSNYGKKVAGEEKIDYTDYVLEVLANLGIDVLVPIGGDDTLSFAVRLHKEGFPIVACPKTMDNDIFGTDYCIGFSTAVTRSVEFITNMRTSVGSHERIGVVELFGRNSGETSLITAYLAYVDRAIISEVPFNMQKLADFLMADKRRNPSNYAIMTISEGAVMEGGEVVESGEADPFGHRKLGGIGQIVCEEIKRLTGQHTMYQQLAYLMRSGAPDSLDRMVAMSFGTMAVQLIRRNETGKMVALHGGKYTTVPIEMVLAGRKRVDVPAYYDIENYKPKIRDFMGVPMFLS
ncbi:pyrophosphate-dependent phosphofructokinase [Bellilinea caldifistulae]|uniref:Phosphofructokinase n=1 Tax=Bellilinea caldifistulae TaxID=360411 RepID=A0A0P6XYY8_9CHLR|nr:6-phosphofructokinase [Bellilinea caldifistulae]KPL78374.1 phosphofructokinase [Bellilinea caldifistulae]GAP10719.1 pyrophosphate-dependent phosphofructokinase [Bellilinea caldifistulae]